MKVIIVEGTPAEIQSLPQLRQLLGMQTPVVAEERNGNEATHEVSSGGPTAEAPVTAELIRKALAKKPVNDRQKAVIGAVYRSPDWISKADISAQTGIDEASVNGVIGGLGLRFSTTRGWPKRAHYGRPSRLVIEQEKRDGAIYYRAKDVFRQGVDLANVLNASGR